MIISVINNKGGTGKTTTCLNLGHALAKREKRTLIIDLDAQCNATEILEYNAARKVQKTLYDLFTSDIEIETCIYPSCYQDLYFIPNSTDTASVAPQIVYQGKEALFTLRNRIREHCRKNFDYVLIDCPPNLEVFVISALNASDFAIVPSVAGSRYSINGLIRAKNFIDDVREEFNPDLRFLKLLITMVDRRTNVSNIVINDIYSGFPPDTIFETTIPINSDILKAELSLQTVLQFRQGSPGAQAYKKLANELIAVQDKL